MRIAMFLDSVFPPDSRVENEAVSLINDGHEVYLFALNYDGRPEKETVNGINVVRYESGRLIYKLSALAYTLPFYHRLLYPKVLDFIKRTEPDALHIHDMVIAAAVFKANKKFNLPIVLDLHENRPVIMKEYVHLKRFPGKYLISPLTWENKQRQLMEKADKIVVVTEEAKEEALSYGLFEENKIIVVPNTIHIDIFCRYPLKKEIEQRVRQENFNVLYVGDTGLRRGTDTAIKAISLLKEEIPEIRLILVGRNTEDVILKAMVKAMGLSNFVSFEGWQDLSSFPSYIKAADICISPLKRNLHHDTTYANKIFQYMAMGKPLLVSDCPAQMNLVKDANCGLIHEAENEKDMADKIKLLYKDAVKRRLLGQNAFKAVRENWNWEITKKQLLETYHQFSK